MRLMALITSAVTSNCGALKCTTPASTTRSSFCAFTTCWIACSNAGRISSLIFVRLLVGGGLRFHEELGTQPLFPETASRVLPAGSGSWYGRHAQHALEFLQYLHQFSASVCHPLLRISLAGLHVI